MVASFPLTVDLLAVLGRRHFPERDRVFAAPEPSRWPGCCFQVPVHNEPPELIARTIQQLLRQQYPGRWMIQVIDNNTPDPATWKPIARLCQCYHQRIQFLHLEQWPGFKAGALNEGTWRLPDWVELIAVIDADYLVHPHFLRAVVRHFADPSVAFVQTPQHYRAWQGSPYFEGLNYMYETFFAMYMTSRRERNSLLCTGTMGLVRRSSLEQVGLWDETCVTEDAELSVRLLGKGWRGVYVHRCYGAGLMPFDFEALKRQRFRWAFGTMQLLKKHWRPLLGLSSPARYHLTLTQRLSYLGIGFQYLIEVVSFFSTLLLAVTVAFSLLEEPHVFAALQRIWLIPLLLLLTRSSQMIWGLRETTGCRLSQAIGALLFFSALSWITCLACLTALCRQRGVFLRTPKLRQRQRWQRALRITAQEALLAAVFLGSTLIVRSLQPANILVIVLFLRQAFIYGMAPVCALAAEGVWLIPRSLLETCGAAFSARSAPLPATALPPGTSPAPVRAQAYHGDGPAAPDHCAAAKSGRSIIGTVLLALSLLIGLPVALGHPARHRFSSGDFWLRFCIVDLLILIIVIVVGAALYLGVASTIVSRLTRPKKRREFVPLNPFVLDLPAEEVYFPPRGGTDTYQVRGLYISCPQASTVILVCPGYRRALTDVLGVCKHLWQAGHSVLAFECYGHGELVGIPVTLGYREVNDFLGAIDYARRRAPDARLGALGYSMGAAISIMGSAQAPEVEALVADSAFATQWSAVELAVHRTLRFSAHLPAWMLGLLRWVTDHLLWLRAGYHFHQVEPVRVIGQIAPRPILLIHGEDDTIVDPRDAMHLYQAAYAPKTLWLIPHTEHIQGFLTDSRAYASKVLGFFDRTLRQAPSMASSAAQPDVHPLQPAIQGPGVRVPSVPAPDSRCVIAPWSRPSHVTTSHPFYSALLLTYGRLLYHFRWATVVLWLVILCAALPFARLAPSVLQNSGYFAQQSESHRVDQILSSMLHQPVTQVLVVFQAKTSRVSDPAYQQEVNGFVARAKTFPHVTQVTLSGPGRDGCSMFVALAFDQNKDLVASRIPDLRRLLPTAASGPAQVFLTGEAATASEIQFDTEADTQQAELIALPVTLLILLLVFGTIVAGALPLILAVVAVPTSLAIIYLVALHVPSNIFEQSVASIIGLGLAIDYSLILLRRFREELAGGKAISEAVATTIATAGEAILFSGATVIIGFAGLFFIGLPVMTGFAVGGIAVALSANLSALTLLPALLSLLGPRVNALRVPGVARLRLAVRRVENGVQGQRSGFWRNLALLVMRRPLPIIALVAVLLVVLGWPALSLNPGLPGAAALPQGSEARQGLALLQRQFPDLDENPIYVIVQTQDGTSPLTEPNLRRVDALTRWIASQAHVTAVTSLTRLPAGAPALSLQQLISLYRTGAYQHLQPLRSLVASTTAGNTTLIIVRANTVAGTSADQALIDRLRTIPLDRKQDLVTLVGGARVVDLDFNRTLYGNFSRACIFILVATYALLLLTFRSLFLPLKAILMNVLSVAAAYGALVFVFQEGHFQEILGFRADGFIDRFIPILAFCILFGLSMDYEVFLLTRIREEWKRTQDNRQAVALGLEKTGGVITSAALLFVIVSSSFLLTSLIVTKELGFGITASVLIDATIIRSLLVPATMQIMGRLNWWLPHFGLGRLLASAPPPPVSGQPGSTQASRGTRSSLPASWSKSQQDVSLQVFVERVLVQLFAQILEQPEEHIKGTSHFFESGGNPQALAVLLSAIEERLKVRLNPEDIIEHPTLFRLATVIVQRQVSKAQLSPHQQGGAL
ncbi:MMPL family transporter [Thermogemmatispora sp.]|uniref:MMPL family transporter n=1 Tax=Thermogemmatispora sp. TaxID=1968838 RepID=UPI0035E40115